MIYTFLQSCISNWYVECWPCTFALTFCLVFCLGLLPWLFTFIIGLFCLDTLVAFSRSFDWSVYRSSLVLWILLMTLSCGSPLNSCYFALWSCFVTLFCELVLWHFCGLVMWPWFVALSFDITNSTIVKDFCLCQWRFSCVPCQQIC